MKKQIVPIILIAASVGLAILSFFMLPESVVIQFSMGSTGNTAVPKLIAIVIPLALGVGGAISELLKKEDTKTKGILVSIIGIALFAIMIVVNCFIF